MNLGTLLVLIGTILSAISFLWGYSQANGVGRFGPGGLLALGATLIGVGVLCGAPAIGAVH